MPKTRRYPPEVRERAVRLVFEHEHEYPSQWSAIRSIAEKSDLNKETLRQCVRQAERDEGRRPGLSTEQRERLRSLEKENKELRRANEILKAASAFFGGRSSTADTSDDRIHRRPQMALGGRADLQGPADRSQHLLRGQEEAAA